jgi:phosphoglycolate phosphatase-like HAD superfamily hydrolase
VPATCVIFDIDGTLVDTAGFEYRLYMQAIRDVLGDVAVRADWNEYEHVTDVGILREICREHAIDPPAYEGRVRTHFGELVAAYLSSNGACVPVPGAIAFFERLRGNPGFQVGIATGGWGHTARMKLRAAGFAVSGVPFASSDDADERIAIMALCRAQMRPADTTVYIGDGEWDQKASATLGWRFVGVGERLRGACRHWVPDLSAPALLESLG